MEKSISLFTALIMFIISATTAQAQFREGSNPFLNTSTEIDTTQNISTDQFMSPYFQTFSFDESGFEDKKADNNLIQFSKPAKLLLQIGTDLIRGGSDGVPLYSFEDAWQYPGPTVRYPETATEYELFLERYQRYTSDY